jgi:iron-sulfur cluster assembly protein
MMNNVVQHSANTGSAVTLTESAKRHLLSYLDKETGYRGVRLSVKKTGCSGLSYVVDFVVEPVENDVVIPLSEQYEIFIDKASYPFLKGIGMDYVKQGLNYKFVFNNPNQTGQCGCGESFTVENPEV